MNRKGSVGSEIIGLVIGMTLLVSLAIVIGFAIARDIERTKAIDANVGGWVIPEPLGFRCGVW